MKKLTKEEFNRRLSQKFRKVELIGDYIDARTKTTFKCQCGFQWNARPDAVRKGTGCPKCNDIALSKEIINQRLADIGSAYRMIGDYTHSWVKTMFQCEKGHQWENSWRKIKEGRGCPHCLKSGRKVSRTNLNAKLLKDGGGIVMIDEYIDVNTKSLFICGNGHYFHAHASGVLSGRGCPTCARRGFNPSKPAWTYILNFGDYIKYGITNNLNNRLKSHEHNGKYDLAFVQYYDDGRDAVKWENKIKRTYGGKYVTKEKCPDGYTETLSINLLETLIKEKLK